MKYQFILTYQATDSETTATRTCFQLHGDDLSISIDRAEGEWYYTRKLDGKLVFEHDDYDWIMNQAFDGTFTLNIKESHDNGATFYDYFTGTFSRASLEIDEDNKQATLNGLKEGVEDLIKNGKNEDYDLMKLIPNSESKIVQGQVPPALALVDYRSISIENSDIFYGGHGKAGGYKNGIETGWSENQKVTSTNKWRLRGIYAEAKVEMKDGYEIGNGIYAGICSYSSFTIGSHQYTSLIGQLLKKETTSSYFSIGFRSNGGTFVLQLTGNLYVGNLSEPTYILAETDSYTLSPSSIEISGNIEYHYKKITIYFHYIRATLLTYSTKISLFGPLTNILDTGDYYKGMSAFNNSDGGLQVTITTNTSEQPNGHRIVPGSDEYGGTPQYFAPPDNSGWIPLAENNWNFASMWYKITPSVANGLLDTNNIGSFTWKSNWTIGCCIKHLLKRITDDKVVFNENTDYSQFLFGNPNPIQNHEPFQWLVTQKSNVMRPSTNGESASRCIVRLDWFLELLRNGLNCYYWFERRNDGRYDFRIEHVEYFRRGGAYNGDLANQLDLTRLKPVRNFLRNGQAAKRYADQTNKYTFDLEGMVEKYTYSWQGDGGGDDFKGNPMYFRAGWIEKGSSDDRQVDNIFADLGWLMLNAGTATESSKNYDGLFIFGGYRPALQSKWTENTAPSARIMTVSSSGCDLWLTSPVGNYITVTNNSTTQIYNGTGKPQCIPLNNSIHNYTINFGQNYASVTIHRVHARSGNIYRVPNMENKLRSGSYLQNGCLAWPWLQKEYLHYDIPAAKWTYLKDEYTDNPNLVWESDGTIKMVKKQNLAVVPVPDANTEEAIMDIMGIKTGLGIGIIDSAKVNLSSRDAEMTIIYDINPQNNQ